RAGRAGDSWTEAWEAVPIGAALRDNEEHAMGNRTFKIFLIKPSHYDDDGYVIQWRLSTIPSNSLASVYGLLAACRDERALGPDVDIEIDPGQANPLYNYLNDMPGMEAAAIPVLPKEIVGRIVGHHACFDAGRGC